MFKKIKNKIKEYKEREVPCELLTHASMFIEYQMNNTSFLNEVKFDAMTCKEDEVEFKDTNNNKHKIVLLYRMESSTIYTVVYRVNGTLIERSKRKGDIKESVKIYYTLKEKVRRIERKEREQKEQQIYKEAIQGLK